MEACKAQLARMNYKVLPASISRIPTLIRRLTNNAKDLKMRLLNNEPSIALDLLNASLEEHWDRFRQVLEDTGVVISTNEIWKNEVAEEAVRRAFLGGDIKLLQVMVTRDRVVASNAPELKSLQNAATISMDTLQDYRWYSLFQAMQGLGQHIIDTVEANPHQNVSCLLVRMGAFPDNRTSYQQIMHNTLGEVLRCSSLLGLDDTFRSLRTQSEMMSNTLAARMIAEPIYLGKANLIYSRGYIEQRVLEAILDRAIVEGFHPASIAWIEDHIHGNTSSDDDDEEVPF
jgi:hypothetical protein